MLKATIVLYIIQDGCVSSCGYEVLFMLAWHAGLCAQVRQHDSNPPLTWLPANTVTGPIHHHEQLTWVAANMPAVIPHILLSLTQSVCLPIWLLCCIFLTPKSYNFIWYVYFDKHVRVSVNTRAWEALRSKCSNFEWMTHLFEGLFACPKIPLKNLAERIYRVIVADKRWEICWK